VRAALALKVAFLLLTAQTACAPKNRVIILGMIHSGHTTSEVYSLDVLRSAIREIEPDYVLTEIPPDRLADAVAQFEATGEIIESRVKRFPEYVDVLFPLTREMEFEIIACAGWTRAMADARQAKLREWEISRPDETREVNESQERAEAIMASEADPEDPSYIHTDRYDELVRQALEPYNRLFNDDLGPGGWDNINRAHYDLIEAALNEHSGEGAMVLITFGAWHKYWFLDQLRGRDDIVIVDPRVYFLTD